MEGWRAWDCDDDLILNAWLYDVCCWKLVEEPMGQCIFGWDDVYITCPSQIKYLLWIPVKSQFKMNHQILPSISICTKCNISPNLAPPPQKKKFKETTGKPFMPTTPLMAFHPQILHLNLETIPMSSTFVITNSSWTSLLAPQHLDRASLLGLSLLNDLGKTSRQDGSGSTMVLQNTW